MSRKPAKQAPSLLKVPFREETCAEFERHCQGSLTAIEYERIQTLANGPCMMLSVFVKRPGGGSLTINHVMADGERGLSEMLGAAAVLGQTARARIRQLQIQQQAAQQRKAS